jgi:transcriptional regulator with PAS, ATPase and Fis domain
MLAETMTVVATDRYTVPLALSSMLEGYDCPAILVSTDYEILATNSRYLDTFGDIDFQSEPRCFEISHGYKVPCDQAGEDCPLSAVRSSGNRERVLHIHQTSRGKEHVDVEMLPIKGESGDIAFFVELLRPVPLASGKVDKKELVGHSPAFNKMLSKVARVGSTNAAVLLLGESGTGKELVAQAIHMASERKAKPMVTLECAGLTESLFESELFGHVKGASTGAQSNKKGLVESAEGGTLFLDEIGDVPLSIQVKLLRLLESGTFRRVGSGEVHSADFRLICATHKNLAEMVEQGFFRTDLFYRINVFPIQLPNLQQRREDIPLLTKTLLARLSPLKDYSIDDSAMQLLTQLNYKGNIRELRNLLNRALVYTDSNVISRKVVEECLDGPIIFSQTHEPVAKIPKDWTDLKQNELNYLHALLKAHSDDKTKAAKIAGISVRSLYRKLEELKES